VTSSTTSGPYGSSLKIGTAPDSWGVWFPSDPEQVPAERFLAEVVEAGYEAIELGPYGYLPNDPNELKETLAAHHLSVLAGTVFSHLHQPDSWDYTWKQVTDVAALTQAVGGEHIVVIPDVWRDHKTGEQKEERSLTDEQWGLLTSGHDELGRRILEEFGLHVQFHSHADSHVGYQPEIERFLEATNPDYVNLCLDTGHVAYYGGDCVDLITRYPERIGYVHLKQVDPSVVSKVLEADLSFPEAVKMGAMIEPPLGLPDMPPVLEALAGLGREIKGIIEHDLYPCAPDVPLPIAKRTKTYLSSCSPVSIDMGSIDMGAVR
jgi:inosose dehydratase